MNDAFLGSVYARNTLAETVKIPAAEALGMAPHTPIPRIDFHITIDIRRH